MEADMEGASGGPCVGGTDDAHQALRDAVATASYEYDKALIEYEAALGSRDGAKRANAESSLRDALRRMSAAQTALAAARAPQPVQRPSFEALLNDPMQQLDADGEVMASVLAYRAAVPSASSASPTWLDRAPGEYRAAVYVHERLVAATVAATTSAL